MPRIILFIQKGESDASDSPKYVPWKRTAIHVYNIRNKINAFA